MSDITKNVIVSWIDVDTGKMERREDAVASEVPLHLFLGSIHFVSFLCSPASMKELIVGYLLGEGVVDSLAEIGDVNFEEDRCRVTLRKTDVEKRIVVAKPFAQLIVSACGGIRHRSLSKLLDTIELKPLPSWKIESKVVLECVRRLNVLAETFRRTGGVHVAALFKQDGELVALAEDVGRHNAVDKVIGAAALSGQELGECFLALSGRMTGDVVLKAARACVPVVASLAAAVDSGVDVAEKAGITLVGFARGSRMNVYTFPERIKLRAL